MAYTPTQWKDRVVEKPRTYRMQDNGDGTITLIPEPGTIYEPGTPVNATNLNKIENGLQAAAATADGAASAISTHASRTDNPHNVTKQQVGLGSVDNYPTASQAEAEAGTAANRFMTPQRTKQYVDTRLQNGLTLREHNGTVERWNQQKGEWEPVAAVFPVGRLRGATLSLTSEQNNAYYTVLDISGVSGRLEFVQAQVSNNGPGHVFYMRVTVDGKSDEFSAQSNTTANMSLNYLVRPYGGANNLVGDVSDPIYFQNSVKVEIKKTGAALSATVRYRLAAGTP